MKAQVALCVIILILGSVASHTVSKRSLLRGNHNHHNHRQQNNRRFGARRQNRRRFGARRRGRDGDHHEEDHHDDHHHEEARAISTGYLPAEEDYSYEDDLPGYGANTRDNLPGYGGDNDDQSQYGADTRDLASYEDTDTTTTTAPDFKDYNEEEEASGETADDQYGAPSDINNDYAEPDGEYGAPEGSGQDETGVDVARNTDYSAPGQAPDTGYGQPGQDDSAPSYDSQNRFPFEAVEQGSQGRGFPGAGGQPGDRQCPGGSIEECVSVCPGSSVRVYGACVGGCADRCPES